MGNFNTVILFGTGRSGTTILMEALFRHPDLAYISSLQEKKPNFQFINIVRYLFDNKIYRVFGKKEQLKKESVINKFIFKAAEGYPVWNHLMHDEVNFSRNFLAGVRPSAKLKAKVVNYLNKVRKIQGKPSFGIKITGPGRLLFMHGIFPDGKFVWLKRDFIPTLSSFLEVDFWQDRATQVLWWEGPYTEDERKILDSISHDKVLFTAFQLNKIIEVIEEEIEKYHIPVLQLSYEQMIIEPEKALANVLDYCNLSHHKDCFNYLKNNRFVNRNKANEDYFDREVLLEMENLLGKKFL
jgi:hypothetical protein